MRTPPRPSALYLAVAVLSWPVLKTVSRLRARGVEHVPPAGGFVVAANHSSNFDPSPLGLPLFRRRLLRFMAKSELFWFPVGAALWVAYGPPVEVGDLSGPLEEQARVATERLQRAIGRFEASLA